MNVRKKRGKRRRRRMNMAGCHLPSYVRTSRSESNIFAQDCQESAFLCSSLADSMFLFQCKGRRVAVRCGSTSARHGIPAWVLKHNATAPCIKLAYTRKRFKDRGLVKFTRDSPVRWTNIIDLDNVQHSPHHSPNKCRMLSSISVCLRLSPGDS